MIKLGNKLGFGFSAVVGGQKSSVVNATPTFIANSTQGKFSINGQVSKALNIASGENIQFINNIAQVEAAIAENDPTIVAWAEQAGVDLTTQEGVDAAMAAFTQWLIAKGHELKTRTGANVMAAVRMSKEEKEKWANEHISEILEANREKLIERVGNPDATDEELVKALTVEDIQFPTVKAYAGSKTANSGSATGVGLNLTFTDSAVWHALKSRTSERMNDIYDVVTRTTVIDDVEYSPMKISVNDGFDTIEIDAYPIVFKESVEPAVVGRNKGK